MPARAWAVVIGLTLATITVAGMSGPQAAPPRGGAAAPMLRLADRHDRSRALREMPVLPPRAGTLFEIPKRTRPQGPRSIDTVVQSAPAAPLLPAPQLSFDGVGNVNLVLPPDTNGDVGPVHFVQWVNLSFAIYAKGSATVPATLLYGPAAGNTLWSGFGGPCETANNGDPVVRYDHLADRWLMSQLAIPNSFFGIPLGPFYQCIAVSETSDPTGAYYRYQFSFDKLNDYPKFGVWPDAYYMTMNQFSAPSLTFAGQGVVAFDRTSMLQGLAAAMVSFDLSTVDMNLGGMLPSDLDGPPPPAGAPNSFLQIDDDAWGYSPDQVQLWDFHVDWAAPGAASFTHRASLPTAPFDSNMCGGSETCIPQPGTSAKLDALSDRLMYRVQYRNFGDHDSIVVNHTVDVDGTDHAGVRWYEIRDPHGTPFIYQQGTYAPDADHRWMASAAMDGTGNLAIGFSVSGPSTYPSIRYAARVPTDPLGQLSQGEAALVAGGGAQTDTSGRWGDYSMLTVDPTDDCTFWYTQEYYAATSDFGWRTRIGAFSVPSCVPTVSTLPAVSIVASTPTAYEAGSIPGAFTVTRTGDTSAPLAVSYHVTGTATAGSDYSALDGVVSIPAGVASATIAVTPIDDTAIEPNESVIVTLTSEPTYTVSVPGSALVTIVSDDLPADLIVSSVVAPSIAASGASITISDTTTNQGTGAAGASTTAFYLSSHLTLAATDPQIGARAVPALAPGASSPATTPVTLPTGLAAGTYRVFAVADRNAVVDESQEGNNTRQSGAIAIGPDLVVSAVTTPAAAAPGASIVVGDTTSNRGGDGAGVSTTAFYLSANIFLDASDVLLGTRAVDALPAGGSSTGVTSVTIPVGTPIGVYYVLAQADSAKAIGETSESNNVKNSSAIQIGPDLALTKITVPSIAAAGGSIVIGDTTANKGAAPAPASSTGFYLSTNFTFDSSDLFLGSRAVAPLDAGVSDSGTVTVTLPATLATGTYYVIGRADYANAVVESNETNNTTFSAGIRIGPNLVESTPTAPASAGSGGQIVITDTVRNTGGGAAGPSTTALYLSSTLTLTSSATLLATRPAPPLAAGASDTASTTVTLPSTVATGTYFVIASADASNQVVETSESDNASFGAAIRIGPDLVESMLVISPTAAPAGTAVTVADTTLNQGGGAAAASTTRFYLSTNITFDSADVALGSRAIPALAAGQSSIGSTVVTIPSGTAPGTYWLLAVSDADGVVPETSETNNTRATSVQVK